MRAENSAGYEAPIGLTADPVVFSLTDDGHLSVLLARRLEPPQRGMFALPGGFVGAGEDPAATAERKLREKTGVASVHLEQLRTYADPARDPRGWLPSIAYMALVPPEALGEGPPGREASWYPVDALPELALDHARIVDDGLWRLRARVADKAWFVRVGGGLLPARFTLTDAQRLYEALRGEPVDAANFRRDVRATGLLRATGEMARTGPGRPASVYVREL